MMVIDTTTSGGKVTTSSNYEISYSDNAAGIYTYKFPQSGGTTVDYTLEIYENVLSGPWMPADSTSYGSSVN